MARRATIQLKVHRQIVQSIPLDAADIECVIQGLRLVTPCTPRINRLIDLLEQICDGCRTGRRGQRDDRIAVCTSQPLDRRLARRDTTPGTKTTIRMARRSLRELVFDRLRAVAQPEAAPPGASRTVGQL
jgi:hypothetical protein